MRDERPPASIESACEELAATADDLQAAFTGVEHDLWIGNEFNVAPTRIDEAKGLRAKGFAAWTDRDLDYVMFKCMTTMGGEATFKFILPRFLTAVSRHPNYGWTSQSHVLNSKLENVDVSKLTPKEALAVSKALVAYARTRVGI